jgi:hypothetical protein
MRLGALAQKALAALQKRGRARRVHRQAGFSATELLVFTAPLCVLSMVLASKLAATSSAHIRAGWQASLSAQQAAVKPCGGNSKLNAPFHPETDPGIMNTIGLAVTWGGELAGYTVISKAGDLAAKQLKMNQAVGDAAAIAAKRATVRSRASMGISILNTVLTLLMTAVGFMSLIPEDVLTSPELVESNWATRRVSAPVERYHFQRAADALIAGPGAVSASATFVCNEPDDGDSVREEKHQQLIGQAALDANGMFF